MKELVFAQPKKRVTMNLNFLKKDLVFTISLILALFSCLIQTPKLQYINLDVIVSLFNLMIVIKALEELKLLDHVAITILAKNNNSRAVSATLVVLCFVSSMFVTNDVALLTFVPLTIIISRTTGMNMMETVILQTIAANIGSSLTPMGNPQNLYIFSHYDLGAAPFFAAIIIIGIVGISLLLFSVKRLPKTQLKMDLPNINIQNRNHTIIWGLLLIVIIASIFGVISPLLACFATFSVIILLNRSLLFKIDYLLLLTFIFFFITIGNISSLQEVQALASESLKDSTSVYFSSIFLSQIISNVPASILLSNFTGDWKALLVGVNVGGLGTIVASLASVISYKLFCNANPTQKTAYLVKFSIYNIAFLVILALVQYLIVFI